MCEIMHIIGEVWRVLRQTRQVDGVSPELPKTDAEEAVMET